MTSIPPHYYKETLIIEMERTRRLICIGAMIFIVTNNISGQTRAEKEISENPALATGKYLAYVAPEVRHTPAPTGYKPCYISTYSRHGSRYLTGKDKYEPALKALEKADSLGELTQSGEKTLRIVRQLAKLAENRYGELTPKGVRQHKELVTRMYQEYPEVFADSAHIDARATYKTRAFLSMAAACIQLKGLNPRLNITTEASEHDAYYIKYKNHIYSDSCQHNADSVFSEARKRFVHPDRIMRQIFKPEYISKIKDKVQLACDLFEYHGISQSSDDMPDLAFLFTNKELYDFWQLNNFEWYYEQGPSPLSGGKMPYLARNLMRNIVETADTALVNRNPGAMLRFGHDTNLAPLVALMEIDEFNHSTADWDSIPEFYQTYRMIPMCGNIQLIFYRNPEKQNDILVKVLLNEREVRISDIHTDCFPFYHWQKLRKAWIEKTDRIVLPSVPEDQED